MKKLVILALLATMFAVARPHKWDNPLPTCNPCPFVR